MIQPDITKLSPNVRNGIPNGRIVVIHATRSGTPMNPSEFAGTLNWFANRASGVSSHWVIARDGRTARCVPDTKIAQHAGQHNTAAWGIELEQGVENDGFTAEQMAALVVVCRGYMEDYSVEPRHTLDMRQSGFVGHDETPQGRSVGKSDPGRLFNWDAFIQLLTAREDQSIMPTVWVTLKDKPANTPFRTYLLDANIHGLTSYYVRSVAEHRALDESNVAGELKEVSIETLHAFHCIPDPLA